MRYVILRDDDTNAFTPIECLERLYRPFLGRGFPVNLAVIPHVRTDAVQADGMPEKFLFAKNGCTQSTMPVGSNQKLVRYLQDNPGFKIVQHGYDHSFFEFDSISDGDICDRLEHGTQLLVEAGFPAPLAFVAPYDKFSSVSLREAAKRFRVISTGWFELQRLPVAWWPKYTVHKIVRNPHWHIGQTALLTHPGCLLSCHRPYATMLDAVKKSVSSRHLTVLVTHWWEYFNAAGPDEPFVKVLHDVAAWLAQEPDLRVISFNDIAEGKVTLN